MKTQEHNKKFALAYLHRHKTITSGLAKGAQN